MRRTPVAATVCVSLSLGIAVVSAQVRVVRHGDDRLAGIHEVDVLVTGSGADSPCRIDVAAVQSRAIAALTTAGIKATVSEKARSWHYSVVIDVRGGSSDGTCATALATELVASVTGVPDGDRALPAGQWGSLLVGTMPLLRHNALVIGNALEHDAAVQQSVERHVSAIATRTRAANP